jgi:hypothetical protein
LDCYLALIKSWVPLVPAELIFILDETGLSDWEQGKPVLIPTTIENTDMHYPGDRGIRHQTLLRCVSALGNAHCFSVQMSPPCQCFIWGFAMELTFESKISHHHISTKSCSSGICVMDFFLQLKATASFQDVEESRQFYCATTAHVAARMRFYESSLLMEFF